MGNQVTTTEAKRSSIAETQEELDALLTAGCKRIVVMGRWMSHLTVTADAAVTILIDQGHVTAHGGCKIIARRHSHVWANDNCKVHAWNSSTIYLAGQASATLHGESCCVIAGSDGLEPELGHLIKVSVLGYDSSGIIVTGKQTGELDIKAKGNCTVTIGWRSMTNVNAYLYDYARIAAESIHCDVHTYGHSFAKCIKAGQVKTHGFSFATVLNANLVAAFDSSTIALGENLHGTAHGLSTMYGTHGCSILALGSSRIVACGNCSVTTACDPTPFINALLEHSKRKKTVKCIQRIHASDGVRVYKFNPLAEIYGSADIFEMLDPMQFMSAYGIRCENGKVKLFIALKDYIDVPQDGILKPQDYLPLGLDTGHSLLPSLFSKHADSDIYECTADVEDLFVSTYFPTQYDTPKLSAHKVLLGKKIKDPLHFFAHNY